MLHAASAQGARRSRCRLMHRAIVWRAAAASLLPWRLC